MKSDFPNPSNEIEISPAISSGVEILLRNSLSPFLNCLKENE